MLLEASGYLLFRLEIWPADLFFKKMAQVYGREGYLTNCMLELLVIREICCAFSGERGGILRLCSSFLSFSSAVRFKGCMLHVLFCLRLLIL